MPLPKDKAWFPKKKYGYGWGFPSKWQGWITMLIYLLLMFTGAIFLSKRNIWLFVLFTIILSGILISVCYWKGEKPGWHWGKK
jgi:hypothetical protein